MPFIDEFDKLPDKSAVGGVLKTLTDVRFIVIGVGKTSADLVGSHPSLDRSIVNIPVPPFSEGEARQVFLNAARASKMFKNSKGISFDDAFQEKVISQSGGYPNLIQKVGFCCVESNRLHRKMFDV